MKTFFRLPSIWLLGKKSHYIAIDHTEHEFPEQIGNREEFIAAAEDYVRRGYLYECDQIEIRSRVAAGYPDRMWKTTSMWESTYGHC